MSTMEQVPVQGKYQPYPEYKDSRVEWLGDIPSNWSVYSLKRSVTGCTNGIWGDEPNGENDLIVLRVADFDRNKLRISDGKLTYRSISEKESRSRLLAKGDLLIEKSGGGDKTLVGCVVLFDKNFAAVTSNFVAKMSAHDGYHSGFLNYAFSHLYNGRINYPSIKQTTGIQNLDSESYLMERFCFPSYTEQRTIAAFLDYETARIDKLIAKQQRLIELLKEKRQAVISHAVTKGLNPDAPMKDSGVEWLGTVPEHWVVSRIKNFAKIESGHTPSRQIAEYWVDCNIPWVSLNDSKTLKVVDYIDDTVYKISDLGMANSSAHLLPGRAVVFTRDASIGLSAITTKPMAVSQHLIAWICNENKVLPEYLLLAFYAMESEFERYTFGATIKTIGMDDVRSLTAAFPSVKEQNEIIDWAFGKLMVLKNALQRTEHTIELLQERRIALISAAVTGKIDLRGWTAPTQEAAA